MVSTSGYTYQIYYRNIKFFDGLFEDGVEIPIEDFENIVDGFISGAKWADNHSNSQWISVNDDLPCNHEELLENENYTKKVLVVLEWCGDHTKKHIYISDMCNVIGSYNVDFYWRCNKYYTVTHWRKLPDIPKE